MVIYIFIFALNNSLVGMSSAASTSVNSYLAYPGEAYAFSDNNLPSADPIRTNVTSLSSPMASSTMEVSRLTVGMRCVVTDRALDAVDPTGWVDAKYKVLFLKVFSLSLSFPPLLSLSSLISNI